MTHIVTPDSLDGILSDLACWLQHAMDRNPYVDQSVEPTHVEVIHGADVVIDDCCPGFGWVRVTDVFPTTAFPAAESGRIDCSPPGFGVSIELGTARCSCDFDEQGNPPTPECLDNERLMVGFDRMAMLQIALGPVADAYGRDVRMGTWTPFPTSGGCLAHILGLTFYVRSCKWLLDWPDPPSAG